MSYHSHFQLADDLISHFDTVVAGVADPFISSRYVGFVAVAGITVYELAIKEIFFDFSEKKHKVFGHFARVHFERINGRIRTRELKREHVRRFGEKYVRRFSANVESAERNRLRVHGESILSGYNNLIEWRNQFAHEGRIPATVAYSEVTNSYRIGKEVIECLAKSMTR